MAHTHNLRHEAPACAMHMLSVRVHTHTCMRMHTLLSTINDVCNMLSFICSVPYRGAVRARMLAVSAASFFLYTDVTPKPHDFNL
jgi:hypothetical protein